MPTATKVPTTSARVGTAKYSRGMVDDRCGVKYVNRMKCRHRVEYVRGMKNWCAVESRLLVECRGVMKRRGIVKGGHPTKGRSGMKGRSSRMPHWRGMESGYCVPGRCKSAGGGKIIMVIFCRHKMIHHGFFDATPVLVLVESVQVGTVQCDARS